MQPTRCSLTICSSGFVKAILILFVCQDVGAGRAVDGGDAGADVDLRLLLHQSGHRGARLHLHHPQQSTGPAHLLLPLSAQQEGAATGIPLGPSCHHSPSLDRDLDLGLVHDRSLSLV